MRLKVLKKLRTVSLNSEFIGSYSKSVFVKFWKQHCQNVRNDRTNIVLATALQQRIFCKTINVLNIGERRLFITVGTNHCSEMHQLQSSS